MTMKRCDPNIELEEGMVRVQFFHADYVYGMSAEVRQWDNGWNCKAIFRTKADAIEYAQLKGWFIYEIQEGNF